MKNLQNNLEARLDMLKFLAHFAGENLTYPEADRLATKILKLIEKETEDD